MLMFFGGIYLLIFVCVFSRHIKKPNEEKEKKDDVQAVSFFKLV
jgi:hypothetical protein